MTSIIQSNKKEIEQLCKQYKVKKLFVFGSAVRDDFNDESDVDMIAEFIYYPDIENTEELLKYFDNMDNLSENFSKLFKRSVDLFTENNIRNKYLKAIINKEKKLIYAEA